MARRTTNGNRLEESMATLINTQASFQANFLAMKARIDARFARIEDEFGELRAILVRHEAILQALPKAILQEIGFKPPWKVAGSRQKAAGSQARGYFVCPSQWVPVAGGDLIADG